MEKSTGRAITPPPPRRERNTGLYNEGVWWLAMHAEGRLGMRDSVTKRYEQLKGRLGDKLGLTARSVSNADNCP